jgi:hypothetical protein
MKTVIEAKVLVTEQIYGSLPSHPERVRECVTAAAQAMNETAADRGREISETPRLVDQRATGLGFVELRFEAATVKR